VRTRLFIVHGSHPCATVIRGLELKGIEHRLVELPPPIHAAMMPLLFSGRTVPAIRFADGEKVQGSRAILRAAERRVPEPALYGSPAIDEAERWGDEVLQPLGRSVLWPAFARSPRSMHSFQTGKRGPRLPMPVVLALAPMVTWIEQRINHTGEARARADLQALPGHLDQIDRWIAEGVLGGEEPNAADLQIGSTLMNLLAIADLRPLIAGRPAAAVAQRWFAPSPGHVPAGTLPADWIAAPAAV
jgi:glutathione S-transferase